MYRLPWFGVTVLVFVVSCGEPGIARNIYVSHIPDHAQDTPNCGGSINRPCMTLNFTLSVIFQDGDTVLLDGGANAMMKESRDHSYVYRVEKSLVSVTTISLVGFNGVPVITSHNAYSVNWFIALRDAGILFVKNLKFFIIGLVSYSDSLNLKILHSVFELTVSPVIHCISPNNSLPVTIFIERCRFRNGYDAVISSSCLSCNIFMNNSVVVTESGVPSRSRGIAIDSAFVPGSLTLDVEHSHFANLRSGISVQFASFQASGGLSIFIVTCTFSNISDSIGGNGSAISIKSLPKSLPYAGFVMSDSIFVNNFAVHGGAVLISNCQGQLYNCKFVSNRATIAAGAFYVEDSNIAFVDCMFYGNIAAPTNVGPEKLVGYGGAVAIYKNSHCTFERCFLENNTASLLGGAIDYRGLSLFLDSTLFVATSRNHAFGDLLYSVSLVNVWNCSFGALGVNSERPIVFHSGASLPSNGFHLGNNDMYSCPSGHNIVIAADSRESAKNSFNFLSISCKPCEKGYYNLDSGQAFYSSDKREWRLDQFVCRLCPSGGICESGIRSSGNFWGYANSNGDVTFIPCPWGYCCMTDNCESIKSCDLYRDGILCNRCFPGYSESLFSPKCVVDEVCDNTWFFPVLVFVEFVFLFILMYLKDIGGFFKSLVARPFKVMQRHSVDPSLIEPLLSSSSPDLAEHDDTRSNSSDDVERTDERIGEDASLIEVNFSHVAHCEESSGYIAGVFKILVFFYQGMYLIKVRGQFEVKQALPETFKELFTGVYNLQITGFYGGGIVFCPFEGLTGQSKVLLKLLCIAALFVLLFVVYVSCFGFHTLYNCWANPHHSDLPPRNISDKPSFVTRMMCCFVQLLLIGYATIATSIFSLVMCVYVYEAHEGQSSVDEGRYLYVDASIKCYQNWQYILLVLAALWSVPFFIGLYLATSLLRYWYISSKEFLVSISCPPLAILYTVRWYRDIQYQTVSDSERSTKNYLLLVIDEPFRKTSCLDYPLAKGEYRNWESVLIFRRLILSILHTFVIDVVVRLYAMIIPLSVYLIHHLHAQPYKHAMLNQLETLSLTLLLLLVPVNLFWGNLYMNHVPKTEVIETLSQVFVYIETAIVLLPVVCLLLLLLYVLILRVYRFCYRKKFD